MERLIVFRSTLRFSMFVLHTLHMYKYICIKKCGISYSDKYMLQNVTLPFCKYVVPQALSVQEMAKLKLANNSIHLPNDPTTKRLEAKRPKYKTSNY
jgi:hypothetical protein